MYAGAKPLNGNRYQLTRCDDLCLTAKNSQMNSSIFRKPLFGKWNYCYLFYAPYRTVVNNNYHSHSMSFPKIILFNPLHRDLLTFRDMLTFGSHIIHLSPMPFQRSTDSDTDCVFHHYQSSNHRGVQSIGLLHCCDSACDLSHQLHTQQLTAPHLCLCVCLL